MSEELMSLEAIEVMERSLGTTPMKARLIKTARAAHSLKEENEFLKKTLERQTRSYQAGLQAAQMVSSHKVQVAKRLHAESSPEIVDSEREANVLLTEENEKLRAVYEAARRVLRFYGADDRRRADTFRELDAACEAMKAADVGNGEEL